MDWFADEHASLEFSSEKPTPIRRRAIRARHVSVLVGTIWSFHLWTNGEAPTGVPVVEKHLLGVPRNQLTISRNIMERQVYVPKPIRVVVTKPVAPVVPVQTELSLVEKGFHFTC